MDIVESWTLHGVQNGIRALHVSVTPCEANPLKIRICDDGGSRRELTHTPDVHSQESRRRVRFIPAPLTALRNETQTQRLVHSVLLLGSLVATKLEVLAALQLDLPPEAQLV